MTSNSKGDSMHYLVTCEDGERRHAEPFETRSAAEHWAEWGHVCTRNHTITETSEGAQQ